MLTNEELDYYTVNKIDYRNSGCLKINKIC